MGDFFKRLFHRFLKLGLAAFACTAALSFLVFPSHILEVIVAYLLSFLFVGSNFAVIKNIKKESQATFYRRFLMAMALRLILVLAAIAAILAATGFHQISFTVSFIISYIFHSVIQIFTIEKLLQKVN